MRYGTKSPPTRTMARVYFRRASRAPALVRHRPEPSVIRAYGSSASRKQPTSEVPPLAQSSPVIACNAPQCGQGTSARCTQRMSRSSRIQRNTFSRCWRHKVSSPTLSEQLPWIAKRLLSKSFNIGRGTETKSLSRSIITTSRGVEDVTESTVLRKADAAPAG